MYYLTISSQPCWLMTIQSQCVSLQSAKEVNPTWKKARCYAKYELWSQISPSGVDGDQNGAKRRVLCA